MINLQDTPSLGPLTAEDLRPYRKDLPAGCDYQGRFQPRPAEACTEVGHSDPEHSPLRDVVVITVAVAITGVWAGWLFTKLLEFFA